MRTLSDLSVRRVSSLLAERFDDLCRYLLPRGRRRDLEWRVGSLAGERGDSLGVQLKGRWRGHWCDWATDEHGDALDLVQGVLGFDTKREAMKWAMRWLGQQGASIGACPSQASSSGTDGPDDDARRRIRFARQMWCEATTTAGSPVETYLRGRGIDTTVPSSIRYAPILSQPGTGQTWPAMVAAVQAPDDQVCGVQATFLTPGGACKAPVSSSRVTWGRMCRGAVRLAPAGPRLGLCEGVEDALSVVQAVGMPCWACLGTSGLRSVTLPCPPLAAEVVIFADHDRCGIDAANAAAERLHAQGRRVRIALPPEPDTDFNDLLCAGQ